MHRMTTWRNNTVATLLASEEAEYVGSSDEMDESQDDAADDGRLDAPMLAELEEVGPSDDVEEEFHWC